MRNIKHVGFVIKPTPLRRKKLSKNLSNTSTGKISIAFSKTRPPKSLVWRKA